MRQRHTRRSRPHLKKLTRRRNQRGGADIQSAKEWFQAIKAFETEKIFTGDYSLSGLRSNTLTLPPLTSENKTPFLISNIQTVYGQTAEAPQKTQIDLRELAQAVTTLFNGEGLAGGLLNQGITTSMDFNRFFNNAKNVSEKTMTDDEFENKRTVWFLNEIEKALQEAAKDIDGTERFKTIYDKPETLEDKFPPFYIWYLAMNPIVLKEEDIKPVFVGVPAEILNLLAPAAQTA